MHVCVTQAFSCLFLANQRCALLAFSLPFRRKGTKKATALASRRQGSCSLFEEKAKAAGRHSQLQRSSPVALGLNCFSEKSCRRYCHYVHRRCKAKVTTEVLHQRCTKEHRLVHIFDSQEKTTSGCAGPSKIDKSFEQSKTKATTSLYNLCTKQPFDGKASAKAKNSDTYRQEK